jgi:nicotinate phosphoribosyltransferase
MTSHLDAYQLTTLCTHDDEGRRDHAVQMAFFFRRMPAHRNYVVVAGLARILAHAATLGFSADEIEALDAHPLLGPALAARPALRKALIDLRGFRGRILAMREGDLAFAGPALDDRGQPVRLGERPLTVYTPLLRVETDLLRAKLIETPWLGFLNHLSMVATKATRIVEAAQGKPVFEFGQRRTHPDAATDASYAAWIGGVAGTSNMDAWCKYRIPATGTMDHFAVQASERAGISKGATETEFFRAFFRTFPGAASFLVDTYNWEEGIKHAVAASEGKLTGIRLDSNVSIPTLEKARALLRELGAPDAKIVVSDGLDEGDVTTLAPYADAFGIGERITCSPDAPVGIGAVAKLTVNGYGVSTMKIAGTSGKATLPGALIATRYPDHDRLSLDGESIPDGGRPLLEEVWRGDRPTALADRSVHDAREFRARALAELPDLVRRTFPLEASVGSLRPLVASDGLVAAVRAHLGASS